MKSKKSLFYFLLFSGLMLSHISPTNAAQGSIKSCQKYSDKIRYYTDLRKMGGSAKKMETWKQQRNKYKKKFSSHNCKKWQDQLSE